MSCCMRRDLLQGSVPGVDIGRPSGEAVNQEPIPCEYGRKWHPCFALLFCFLLPLLIIIPRLCLLLRLPHCLSLC